MIYGKDLHHAYRLIKQASSHTLCACDEVFLGLVLLFYNKKKRPMSLFFKYNFYFENLIYKWIKQFENQQDSNSIF